jgi:exonuclease SbcD
MKLLHTGDLHLGKSLHETSLLEDQKHVLNQLARELARDRYAALLVAGDIYDRTIPPAEAVELFSDFLVRLRREAPDLEIVLIPGNHDSAQRLSYADRILGAQRIHIVTRPEASFEPIIIEKDGERTAIFALPFLAAGTLTVRGDDGSPAPKPLTPKGPTPTALVEANAAKAAANAAKATTDAVKRPTGETEPEFDFSAPQGEPAPATTATSAEDSADEATGERGSGKAQSQAALALEASKRLNAALDDPRWAGLPSVLVAHLFTLAAQESSSERLFLGTAEKVNPALFTRFSYVALGHLHKGQKVTDRMYYSGAPLAYAFDEAASPKRFLRVEIDAKTAGFPVTVTPIPVTPLRAVTRLAGHFADFHTGTAWDRHAGDYLEITLTDEQLVTNPVNLLRAKFPYLLSLRQGERAIAESQSHGNTDLDSPDGVNAALDANQSAIDARNPLADFRQFETMLYGAIDEERARLFASLLAECEHEA